MTHAFRFAGWLTATATVLWLIVPASWAALEGNLGPSAASKLPVISGKIASIDPRQRTLMVQSELLPAKEFVVDAQTKITDGQRSLQLDQLQPNAEVTIQYAEENGRRKAHSITVNSRDQFPQSPSGSVQPAQPAPPQRR